jgi:hypothetical protein
MNPENSKNASILYRIPGLADAGSASDMFQSPVPRKDGKPEEDSRGL